MEKSRLDPVMKEQQKVEYENTERLCQEVAKLGGFPFDCEVTIPEATLNKEVTITIDLQDYYGVVDDENSRVDVSITTKMGEAVEVEPVKIDGNSKYAVSFTPRTPGDHSLAVAVNGNQCPGNPYR